MRNFWIIYNRFTKPIFIFIYICDLYYIPVNISDSIASIHDDDVNDKNYDGGGDDDDDGI
jgi:hypothetical protein